MASFIEKKAEAKVVFSILLILNYILSEYLEFKMYNNRVL